jgi:hypothetical protein
LSCYPTVSAGASALPLLYAGGILAHLEANAPPAGAGPGSAAELLLGSVGRGVLCRLPRHPPAAAVAAIAAAADTLADTIADAAAAGAAQLSPAAASRHGDLRQASVASL